jgi:hypothetical protein
MLFRASLMAFVLAVAVAPSTAFSEDEGLISGVSMRTCILR